MASHLPPYEKPPKPSGLTIKTPNIDGFAAEGTRFANCSVQASVCAQSRWQHLATRTLSGHQSLENLAEPREPNLFRSLREKGGYHVACLAPAVTELSLDEYRFSETPKFVPRFASGGCGCGGGGRAKPENKEDIWRRLFYMGLRNPSEAMDYDDAVGQGRAEVAGAAAGR
ncbi:hypothetical protein CTA2_8858 [Colletotrichum tanaceti]|uniref:Uncharacterized protein n=1 Tax=Colletotrichum tanaceti TaxID=1306861 RepID=A0A4U6X090_9PEZI|nr:hypothetical protein CTA2_8858 [Colletotrichum tanaceti]TKW48781.1 hypothetical protein CTA1_6826 [Colletotrichum tanaceti]